MLQPLRSESYDKVKDYTRKMAVEFLSFFWVAVEFQRNVAATLVRTHCHALITITYLDLMDRLSQVCHHHKDHIEMPLSDLIEDYHL